jgi:hypothetical protein
MTQAKAATVAAAIVNAGYLATVSRDPDGTTWRVRARSATGTYDVPVATVDTFAANNGVAGLLAEIEFS